MKKILLIVGFFLGAWTGIPYIANAAGSPQNQHSDQSSLTVPVFRDADINQGLAEYKSLLEGYTDALSKHDHTLMEKYAVQIEEWYEKVATWIPKMNVEEQDLFLKYKDALREKHPVQTEEHRH
jgi:hypothetical protein